MKRLRHLPIVWGPTPSRVATTALLGSRSQASTIFARNVSAAGSERDRVMAKRCVRSSLDIVSIAFGRPVRIGYLLPSGTRSRCNNYAANLRDGTVVPQIISRSPHVRPGKFVLVDAKRVLQQYRHEADIRVKLSHGRIRG